MFAASSAYPHTLCGRLCHVAASSNGSIDRSDRFLTLGPPRMLKSEKFRVILRYQKEMIEGIRIIMSLRLFHSISLLKLSRALHCTKIMKTPPILGDFVGVIPRIINIYPLLANNGSSLL